MKKPPEYFIGSQRQTGCRRSTSTGMPLNFQLTTRGGTLHQAVPGLLRHYKLYALKNTTPPNAGLQYNAKGCSIEVEVWDIPRALFGDIVAEVPAPLGDR